MNQDLFEWILLIARWVHITVAVTWIGTSIFFMWLDRTFERNQNSTREGHVGEVWMVHGGGFYHVEKLLMGPTKVPQNLHWFKWESYWTWMSGAFLVTLIFYTGDASYLLDSSVSSISYSHAVMLGIFSMVGSWLFYDFLWERHFTKTSPVIGHTLTLCWFAGMSYLLCKNFSGRAAYIHIGGMLGTWMTANVFMRIIPRQLKMVEASARGEPVNQEWGKNAKNRSTHNTYFTLPVIFIMLSNHFPMTYGHEYNWLILLLISASGASIRAYFVDRLKNPTRAKYFVIVGILILLSVMFSTISKEPTLETTVQAPVPTPVQEQTPVAAADSQSVNIKGMISFEGSVPLGKRILLPSACAAQYSGAVYSDEIIVNNGKLQNVLVRITKGLEGKIFDDIPSSPVILDQKGCIYHPRVVAARVGQEVVIINSDTIFHNVRSISKNNPTFNIPMAKKDQRISKRFDHSEIFMQAKCSVHPWMGANIAVVDHPYFSISDDKGEFFIKDLPEGQYTIEAWHEVYGSQTQEINISAQKNDEIKFVFKKQ
jgi:uncharacterized membrane protein/plastocyanin